MIEKVQRGVFQSRQELPVTAIRKLLAVLPLAQARRRVEYLLLQDKGPAGFLAKSS